jgi:hypothetical protein
VVYLSEAREPHTPLPVHTVYVYRVSLFTQRRGGGELSQRDGQGNRREYSHKAGLNIPWMKELKGIIHGGEGAFLRCPVSTSVQFSLRDEGSTEYMCVRGKITGDNIYRCQSACPGVLNDFDLFKENKTSQSL